MPYRVAKYGKSSLENKVEKYWKETIVKKIKMPLIVSHSVWTSSFFIFLF